METDINRLLREARALESTSSADAVVAYANILKDYPNAIAAHLRLSELWQQQDEYRRSLAQVGLAVESLRRTRRWEALPFVTLRLLAFSERELAKRLIVGADWAHPAVIQQSPTLSQHLWLCGAYEEALDLIKKAAGVVGPNALLSYSRANALRYSGRLDQATAELEHCLAIDPGNAFAHWSLAYHVPSHPPGARVDRIRAALRATQDATSRIHLNYALFKELDDAGDTASAWEALREGASLKRRTLSYDANAESQALAELRSLAEKAETSQGFATEQVPLFVVGMPRTGTTLLERILSNHKSVSAGGELGEFPQAASWQADRFVSSPPERDMLPALAGIDFRALGERYLQKTEPYWGGRNFMIDKNPVNIFNAWAIAKALPRARILCLVRGPMDACFSNLKELFSGPAYPYSYDFQELATHYRAFVATAHQWQALYPEQFKVVRYEDLTTSPEKTSAAVANFCGLDAQDGMTDMTTNRAPVLTASYAQVRQPIHTRGVGAWQRYAKQLQPLEAMFERP